MRNFFQSKDGFLKKHKEEGFWDHRFAKYKKIIRWLWILTGLFVLSLVILFVFLSNSDLPGFEELENPKYDQATQVLANDGTVLGKFYIENRVAVDYDELSPNLTKALIATEDERYLNHSGIDMKSLMRMLVKTGLLRQKSSGGGSTITQQLAKLLFTEEGASGFERVIQKLKEWVISIRLERKYTKNEIIAMYLNKFNFINGAYGIKAASEIYFNKSPKELSINESATLIGMLKNPSLFNPVRRLEKTQKRRNVVLGQMYRNDDLTKVEFDSLSKLTLDLSNFKKESHTTGPGPYFRMQLREKLKSILKHKAKKKQDGSVYDIYRDGLKIYTTIDPTIQKYAEEAVAEHMKSLQKKFDRAWAKEDPWTWRNMDEKNLTSDEEMIARKKTLDRLMKNSERGKALRKKYLDKITTRIIDEGLLAKVRNIDIERMVKQEKDITFFKMLRDKKLITKSFENRYKKFMKTEAWPALKSLWNKYLDKLESSFHEEVAMKVFTYENFENEKDTVLTPFDSIKYHRNFLQVGSLSLDPKTGFIKSWVGGINHKYFKYDHVTSNRQVGSTFKPLIYATAIAQLGMSPCQIVDDIPYTIHVGEGRFHLQEPWTPTNAGNEYSGEPFTLFKGLQYSKNTVSTYLMKQIGDPYPVVELAENMGIGKGKVPPVASICLGSPDLTVLEMSGAYTTFANNGFCNKPVFIDKIVDKNNKVIYTEYPDQHPALEPNVNYVMVQMLKKVTSQGIPGFENLKSEFAGKTGTTNDYVDGWFMGITPNLVCGTWVGGDNVWIRFRSMRMGIGAKMARPIFSKLMNKIESDSSYQFDTSVRFEVPDYDIGIELDCDLYQDGKQEQGGYDSDTFGDELTPVLDSNGVIIEPEEDDFGEEF